MLTNCLAACAHLTITVSEIQPDICEKIVIYPPLHSTPPLGGFPSEYYYAIGQGKTRMVWLPMVKKIRFDMIHEHERHTHRHRMTA